MVLEPPKLGLEVNFLKQMGAARLLYILQQRDSPNIYFFSITKRLKRRQDPPLNFQKI
jgi:hypothetical protein